MLLYLFIVIFPPKRFQLFSVELLICYIKGKKNPEMILSRSDFFYMSKSLHLTGVCGVFISTVFTLLSQPKLRTSKFFSLAELQFT